MKQRAGLQKTPYCTSETKRVLYADQPLPQGPEIQKFTPEAFAVKHGFDWSDSILISSTDYKSTLFPESFTPITVAEGLVVCHINEKVGCGLFAQTEIPANTTLLIYTGQYAIGVQEAFEQNGQACDSLDRYVVDLPVSKGSQFKAISSAKVGNLGRFVQHLPQSEEIEKMVFNPPELKKQVAIANTELCPVRNSARQLPYVKLVSTRKINRHEQVGFSYGIYWLGMSDSGILPEFFNRKGNMIDRECYVPAIPVISPDCTMITYFSVAELLRNDKTLKANAYRVVMALSLYHRQTLEVAYKKHHQNKSCSPFYNMLLDSVSRPKKTDILKSIFYNEAIARCDLTHHEKQAKHNTHLLDRALSSVNKAIRLILPFYYASKHCECQTLDGHKFKAAEILLDLLQLRAFLYRKRPDKVRLAEKDEFFIKQLQTRFTYLRGRLFGTEVPARYIALAEAAETEQTLSESNIYSF